MSTISTEELHALLQSDEPVTLVMAMSEAAFSMGHIPGSIHATNPRGLGQLEEQDTRIVVYCTGPDCAASGIAYRQLVAAGFLNVLHYAGGPADWTAYGLQLESGPLG
jgi:rhodanese-related sulfurtransferase